MKKKKIMETIVDEIKRCVCLDINSEEKVDIKESIVTLLIIEITGACQ